MCIRPTLGTLTWRGHSEEGELSRPLKWANARAYRSTSNTTALARRSPSLQSRLGPFAWIAAWRPGVCWARKTPRVGIDRGCWGAGHAETALSGFKILDLTHYVAGPSRTKLLADFGAEVIKIERPPQKGPAPRIGPFPADDPIRKRVGCFLHRTTNKLGITLNLKTPRGVSLFKELLTGGRCRCRGLRASASAKNPSRLCRIHNCFRKPYACDNRNNRFGNLFTNYIVEQSLTGRSYLMYKAGDSRRSPRPIR